MPRLDSEDNPVEGIRRFLGEELKHRLPGHEARVDEAVEETMERFIDEFGGHPIYLHKNHAARQGKIYAAIVAEFTGDNARALATKYGKSVMRIRQILRAEQKRKPSGKRDQEKP